MARPFGVRYPRLIFGDKAMASFHSPIRALQQAIVAAVVAFGSTLTMAAEIEVLHADSLAGPLRAVKTAFEAKQPGTTVKLTSGVSKQLAERILKGDACDV